MKGVIGFYGLLLGSSMFFGLLYHVVPALQVTLADQSIFVAMVVAYFFMNQRKVAKAFLPRKPKLKRLVELGLLAVAAFFFLLAYFWTIKKMGWPMAEMTKDFTEARWPLWGILGMISVLPGVFEEIAFRGIIQTKLSRILSVREALVIQAALFSILHLSPIIFVSHFVMGLLLGWARLRLGHVYLGMVLHMSWNAYCVFQELAR